MHNIPLNNVTLLSKFIESLSSHNCSTVTSTCESGSGLGLAHISTLPIAGSGVNTLEGTENLEAQEGTLHETTVAMVSGVGPRNTNSRVSVQLRHVDGPTKL